MAEAERQSDAMTNPRTFLAFFPSGPRNGLFLDPYMGLIQIKGIEGFILASDLDIHSIPAIWAD